MTDKLPPLSTPQNRLNNNSDIFSNQPKSTEKSQISSMHLFQIQKEKKSTQIQSNILENRIKRLIMEDQKLQKKIEETQKKAYNIYEIKKQTQQQQKERQEQKMQLIEIPFTHPIGQLALIKCQMAKDNNQNIKKQQIQDMKQKMIQDKQKQKMENNVKIENLKWNVNTIKQQTAQAKIKKELYLELRNEEVRREQQRKYEQELLEKQKEEEKIQHLEKLEVQMFDKLKSTKSSQKKVNEQLEFSIKKPPKVFAQKYGEQPENQNKKMPQQISKSIDSLKSIYNLGSINKKQK